MNTIFVDIMSKTDYDAGPKARNDVAKILSDNGFQKVMIYDRAHGKIGKSIDLLKALWKMPNNIKNSDIVVIQYPYGLKVMELLLNKLQRIKKKNKKLQSVILIHDVGYLRKGDDKGLYKDIEEFQRKEIAVFNQADFIISHTENMTESLRRKGVKKQIINLGPFDYLYEGRMAQNVYTQEKPVVVFAGNLSKGKSRFLYDYERKKEIEINVYGKKQEELPKELNYCGSYPPDELISHLSGNYGLVWDGDSTQTCSGYWGEYLKYNCPHKLSLYIAAGLPVIVWKESALASYVQELGLGVCVNNLIEMAESLSGINAENYQKMRKNVLELRQKLIGGNQIKNVLKEIERQINEAEG